MKIIAVYAILAGAGGLFGTKLAAQTLTPPPPEVRASQPQAQLQGQTTLRFLGLPIYDARLWAAPGFALERFGQQPLVLELQYRRALSGARIAERSIAEMRRQSGFDAAAAPAWGEQLTALFPDVAAGDRLTGAYTPEGGARFWHNGRSLGTLDDVRLARLFFGIWLSPQTSEPTLRCELAACTAPGAATRTGATGG